MAAGPSLEGRTGIPGQDLPRDNKAFEFISDYIAQMLFNTYVNLRPAKIILGGSVLSDAELPMVREYFEKYNNGYVATTVNCSAANDCIRRKSRISMLTYPA